MSDVLGDTCTFGYRKGFVLDILILESPIRQAPSSIRGRVAANHLVLKIRGCGSTSRLPSSPRMPRVKDTAPPIRVSVMLEPPARHSNTVNILLCSLNCP